MNSISLLAVTSSPMFAALWYDALSELAGSWGYVAFFALLGAILGSFSGVLVSRVPAGEPITHRSRCDTCNTPVAAWQNIPLMSYLIQRGRCPHCKARIPLWVWGIEVISAAGWGLGAWLTGDLLSGLAFGFVVTFAVVLGGIDWKTTYIYWGPYFSWGALAWAATIAWGAINGTWDAVLNGVVWGFGSAFALWGINWLYKLIRKRDGLGYGDGLLVLVSVGVPAALTGTWIVPLYGLYAGFVLASIWGVAATRDSGQGGAAEFALGPYLMAGPILAWAALALSGWLAW